MLSPYEWIEFKGVLLEQKGRYKTRIQYQPAYAQMEDGYQYINEGYKGCIGRKLERASIFPNGKIDVCSYLFDTEHYFARLMNNHVLIKKGFGRRRIMYTVLVNPPQGMATGRKPNIDNRPYLFPPGILSLASSLESAGHRVEIIDFPTNGWKLGDFEQWIEVNNPDVLAISFCSPSLPYVKAISKSTKCLSHKTQIIVGGPHVTFSPSELLEEKTVDYVVRFEGEISIVSLIEELCQNKKNIQTAGVSYCANDQIIHNKNMPFIQNLDELPMPAYHLLDMAKYKIILNRVAVCGMRGCVFNCKFCTISQLMGKNVRTRSPEIIVEELKLVIQKYDMNRISFTDPNFALYPERIEEFYKLFQKEGIDIQFGCQTRLHTLTDAILETLKQIGCVAIFIGIESGSEKILRSYNKDTELKLNLDSFETLKKVAEKGIGIIPSFIIGSPEEDEKSIFDTIDLARKYVDYFQLTNQEVGAGGNYQINAFGPFPGLFADQVLPLELPIEFAPAMPICGTKYVARSRLAEIWRGIYREFFPRFVEKYMDLAKAAENNIDLYFNEFSRESYI